MTSMEDDVLPPFVEAWERAKRTQQESDQVTAASPSTPRLDPDGDGVVLVRVEPSPSNSYGHAVTVRFTTEELSLLEEHFARRYFTRHFNL